MAGSETTATALTGAIYQLAKNQEVLSMLHKELSQNITNEAEIDFNSTAKLPYLGAIIQESLRFYPPGPNAQPRITPVEGNFVLGDHLPGSVCVNAKQEGVFSYKQLTILCELKDCSRYSTASYVP